MRYAIVLQKLLKKGVQTFTICVYFIVMAAQNYQRKRPRRGEIWICDLGNNVGSEQNGIRPCVVLNQKRRKENTCIILPASHTGRHSSVSIEKMQYILHQIRVADTKRFLRRIDRVSQLTIEKLVTEVGIFLRK